MYRLLVIAVCVLVAGACEQAVVGPNTPAGPSATTFVSGASSTGSAGASSTSSMVGERPWKANLRWTVTGLQFANPEQPFDGTKSLFGGRCSVPSDYVISGAFEGEATHAGQVTGTTGHCSQITFGPQGPASAAYTDGRGSVVAANGSTVTMIYGQGVSGIDPATGENFFHDVWTFTGGTGLFDGATGNGEEEGRFMDFNALLAGGFAEMWMEGTVTYNPSGK